MQNQDLSLTKSLHQLKQYIPLVLPFVSIAVLTILLVKFLLPETLAAKGKFEKLDERKAQIFKLEKKLQILNEFEKSTLVDLIEKSQILIPTSDDLASLLIYLKSIESQSGVLIDSFNFQAVDVGSKGAKSTTVTGVRFGLTLIGEKEQLFNFFRLMDDPTKRILSVEEMSLDTKGKQTIQEETLYNADVLILAPFAPFPTKVGGVKEEIPELSDTQRDMLEEIALISLEASTSEFGPSSVDFEPRDNPFVF